MINDTTTAPKTSPVQSSGVGRNDAVNNTPTITSRTKITAHGMFGMGKGKTYNLANEGRGVFAIVKSNGDLLTKRYSTEELLSAWRAGRLSIDGNRVDRKAEMAMEKQAKADAEAAVLAERRATRAAEYAASPASVWIEATLGTEFANDTNRQLLARALDGKDQQYQGLVGWRWIAPLEAIGYDHTKHGDKPYDILKFLREKYEAVQSNHKGVTSNE